MTDTTALASPPLAWGILMIALGGVFNGVFAYPMKLARDWNWENIWLAFGVLGLLFLPAAVAFSTVPSLCNVYRGVPPSAIVTAVLLGIAWGGGSLLFGLGISALGLSLGYAIIMGTTAVLGTIVPLALVRADSFGSRSSGALLASVVLILVGLWLCAAAGNLRDRLVADGNAAAYHIARRSNFVSGLLTCAASGVLSACFNIGFAATGGIRRAARVAGADELSASFAVWALIMSAGAVPSLLFCTHLLRKNGSFHLFRKARRNWLCAAAMAVMWILAIALYGAGAGQIGALGATIGWPILVSTAILSANAIGLASAEWRNVPRRVLLTLEAGLLMLVSAVVVASIAGG